MLLALRSALVAWIVAHPTVVLHVGLVIVGYGLTQLRNGLKAHPEAQGFLSKVLDLISIVSHSNSPGTFKAPGTFSQPPPVIGSTLNGRGTPKAM